MKHKFTNDYSSLCHLQILKDLSDIALEQNVAYGLELWEDKGDELVVRFVLSFTTKKSDVDDLLNFVKNK